MNNFFFAVTVVYNSLYIISVEIGAFDEGITVTAH